MPTTCHALAVRPFSVAGWLGGSRVLGLLAPLIDKALGLASLQKMYEALPGGAAFPDAALEALAVRYRVDEQDLSHVPAAGPLVVVANHPYGGIDGLVLASLLRRVRPDVKLLANRLLGRIPELQGSLFLVDAFHRPEWRRANAGAVRAAIRWVREGGALAIFPAGEVAHERTREGAPVEGAWPPAVGRLARHAAAPVLPVFFEGGNSGVFGVAGRIHPRLRTALLARELLNTRGRVVDVRIGPPIPVERLNAIGGNGAIAGYLRVRTCALGERGRLRRPENSPAAVAPAPVAEPEPRDRIAADIATLRGAHVLSRSGSFTVYWAAARDVPHVLREIGRLREIAFRRAGEGTGAARDLDAFDSHYLHLFVWNDERQEIVGAYRAAATDQVLPRHGLAGLYTSTLFGYDLRLLDEIGPALELGRAFVRPEYQRDYTPLLLLWKGIGAYVAARPRYRMLFGPVSISNDYGSLSRQILASFLYHTRFRADLAPLLRPRNPPQFLASARPVTPEAARIVRTVREAGALLAEIEADGKGVPVLLRQYLKLNAQLLGFNLDPAFGNVLDGLMLVDLMNVDEALLARYMGRSGAAAFRAQHGARLRRRAAGGHVPAASSDARALDAGAL